MLRYCISYLPTQGLEVVWTPIIAHAYHPITKALLQLARFLIKLISSNKEMHMH